MQVCVGSGSRRSVLFKAGLDAVITSDAPRETSALVGCESLGRRAYRLAAQTQPRSASRPRRRTWWLTGSAAKSGTRRISGKDAERTFSM